VDWSGVALVLVVLAVAITGIAAVIRVGIKINRRPSKSTRIRRTKGEYQPPDPPEGRYWG
jgi:Na+-transporting methylmalonyl-CoA/oxaloacetate decarboxylase gamma subunit